MAPYCCQRAARGSLIDQKQNSRIDLDLDMRSNALHRRACMLHAAAVPTAFDTWSMDAAAAPRYTHGGYSLRFSDGFYEKVSRGYIESFAVHLLFKVDNDSQGLTRQMGPLSSIMQAGREPCKFVDSPARFLNLYGRLYGPCESNSIESISSRLVSTQCGKSGITEAPTPE